MNILLCCCANAGLMPSAEQSQLLDRLGQSNARVTIVADLCRQVASGTLQLPLSEPDPLTIIACRPRAVRALLEYAGMAAETAEYRFFDLRHQSADDILSALDLQAGSKPSTLQVAVAEPDHWQPWFPVIDRERCVNCGQCQDFCLFGVYERDAQKRVVVANPASCKNNCPACARICPQAAIIFPKHNESPIDGGNIQDEDQEARRIRVDVQKILGEDPYETLKQRRAKARQGLVDRQRLAQAERERQSQTPQEREEDRS